MPYDSVLVARRMLRLVNGVVEAIDGSLVHLGAQSIHLRASATALAPWRWRAPCARRWRRTALPCGHLFDG